jgi:predicted transcriptional regulator
MFDNSAGQWHASERTVGQNRTLLNYILELKDDQQICNFVVIAQVHGIECTPVDHKGVIVTSLDDEDVTSFVLKALSQLT